jgi:transcriptional regulator with XRE-family HTH domain
MAQQHTGTAPDRTTEDERRVSERLRAVRAARRLSQTAFAMEMIRRGHTGWTQATVSNTETGTRPLRLLEAVAAADVLGVPLAALVADAPEGGRQGDPAADLAAAELALAAAVDADLAARERLVLAQTEAADAAQQRAQAAVNVELARLRVQQATTDTTSEG